MFGIMRRLPQDEALAERAWLEERDPGGYYCGYDAGAWPAATWVLNAIYENPDYVQADDDDREHKGRSIGFDGSGIAVSGGLGYEPIPPAGWSRLRWVEFAQRLNWDLGAGKVNPPCFHWFPTDAWTSTMLPPTEGSLDERSLRSIVETLEAAAPEPSGEYFAFWGEGPSGNDGAEIELHKGTLTEIVDFVHEQSHSQTFSPSNIWPVNRAWLTSTDWDLWGTQIGGSPELIAALEANEHLETLRWERPPASD